MRFSRLVAIIGAFALLGATLTPLSAQQLEKRIALVVGESAYSSGPVPTAADDAGLVAQTLQAAGFDVTGARDLDTQAFRASLHEFVEKARASGPETVAMIYFSGYGLQSDGENFLAGVDARIDTSADVAMNAIRVSDFVKPLAALPLKARIVVLDAARKNPFVKTGQTLAGGLALMEPDDGSLVAFNAAPGTIGPDEKGPYGAYAKALVEMIKAGGAPVNEMFERVRMRVSETTQGAENPWSASRITVPFVFFTHTAETPKDQSDRFPELVSKPVTSFSPRDAYLAAVARDTLEGYEEFLAAFPNDRLAKRVRAIVAARREAVIWRQTCHDGKPRAYWSYLSRYRRGPHVYEARRALAHLAAPIEPPETYEALAYDVPPPPPDEIAYVEEGPVVYLADPYWDFPPPPPPPVIYFVPPPAYIVDLPPPPPPIVAFELPIPVYYPVATWVAPPPYIAPAPVNVFAVNVHNTVIVNQAANTVMVTNPAGQSLPPLPAHMPAPGAAPGGLHPGVAAAAVALPAAAAAAAALRGQRPTAFPPRGALPIAPGPTAPAPTALPTPGRVGPNFAPPHAPIPPGQAPNVGAPRMAPPSAAAPFMQQRRGPQAPVAAPFMQQRRGPQAPVPAPFAQPRATPRFGAPPQAAPHFNAAQPRSAPHFGAPPQAAPHFNAAQPRPAPHFAPPPHAAPRFNAAPPQHGAPHFAAPQRPAPQFAAPRPAAPHFNAPPRPAPQFAGPRPAPGFAGPRPAPHFAAPPAPRPAGPPGGGGHGPQKWPPH